MPSNTGTAGMLARFFFNECFLSSFIMPLNNINQNIISVVSIFFITTILML